MIGKIQDNQLRELLEALSSRKPNAGSAVPNSDADVSVQVNYNSLIEQAMQPSKADGDIVDAARKLLLSGKLESPQNYQEAAKNILKLGI
jgi:hypothetical protein